MCRGLVVLARILTSVKHKPPNRHKISHRTPENNQSAKWHKHTAQDPKTVYIKRVKGTQPTMRKIETEMNKAINNAFATGQGWSKDNTTVHVNTETNEVLVRLYGNLIAVIDEDSMTLKDGGHQTVTTKSRLNALCDEFCNFVSEGVFQKAGVWYVRKCVGMINGQRCFKNIEFGDGFTFA